MSFSPDPRKTGWLPSSSNTLPDGNLQQNPSSQLNTSQSDRNLAEDTTIPLTKLAPQAPASRLKKPLIWTIISIVILLCIVLGFVMKNGQPPKTTGVPNTQQSSTPNGQPGQSSTPSLTPGSYTSTSSRLFASTSPWNVPIGTNVQLDPHSSDMVDQLTPCCHVSTLYRFGMPIYTSSASDPSYTVQDTGNDSLFESHQPIHIPDVAAPSPGSDHWLFIFDKTQNLIFEMWNTHKSGNSWTTQTGDVYSPTGDGVLQVDGSQQSGNGASYFGGVVTDADIQRGYINHALSFATSDTSQNSWRYPMNASDGNSTDSSALPMGARLQLDPSVNCSTLASASTGEKMICQALETYGGYIRDSGGVTLSMYFEGEDLNDPNRNPPSTPGDAGRPGGIFNKVGLQDSKDLSDIPWNKLRVLKAWNSYTPLSTAQSSVSPANPSLPQA